MDYKTVAVDSVLTHGVPQVQIWDTTKEGGKWKIGADKGPGALNTAPTARPVATRRASRQTFWRVEHFRIKMVGDMVTIKLNGKLVVDNAPSPISGTAKRPRRTANH